MELSTWFYVSKTKVVLSALVASFYPTKFLLPFFLQLDLTK